ncbi:hypothetical protein D018_3549B, partial [Vibrio parahaemolyticus VP2007-007]
ELVFAEEAKYPETVFVDQCEQWLVCDRLCTVSNIEVRHKTIDGRINFGETEVKAR